MAKTNVGKIEKLTLYKLLKTRILWEKRLTWLL
jgi:hypothetical protein